MNQHRPRALLPLLAAALFAPAAALAQPADLTIPPATTTTYPPGVATAKTPSGTVYTNRRGITLYGMDMRTLLRHGPDPAQYCTGECAATWEPLLAPANAVVNIRYPGSPGRSRADGAGDPDAAKYLDNRKAPDWTVIAGPQGPQWVYKGWHMVFTRRGDAKRSVAYDGAGDGTAEKVWNTLKFVPPVPVIVAPTNVTTRFAGGAHVLADKGGRLLYSGKCKDDCGAWRPFTAGMASLPIGQWTVSLAGDVPQWAWRGKPVFVAIDDEPANLPAAARLLQP